MARRIFSSRRRQRLAAGVALLLAAGVVAAAVLSSRSPSSPSSSSGAATASGSSTVQRRNLVETDTESGTLGYADPQTVYGRLNGTITSLPSVGQVIKPGQTLYRVDGAPVILMDGATPAYRDLKPSDSAGADIEQLNRNLFELGFDSDGIVVDDDWQPATTTGVELLQESLGETETGSLLLGRVVFLPGDQLVSTVEATVGSTGGGGGSSPAATNASTSVAVPSTEFVGLTTSKSKPAKSRNPASGRRRSGGGADTLAGLTTLLRAEAAQLRAATAALNAARASITATSPKSSKSPSSTKSPKSGSSTKSPKSGSSAKSPKAGSSDGASASADASATAILQTSSTRLVVTVDLSASSQSEAVLGEPVTVELPDGDTVGGRITAVSPVAQAASSSGSGAGASSGAGSGGGSGGSSSTVPVTITLEGHIGGAGLDQAAVSVNFAEAKAKHVLSVPVTALIATSGGNYAVQEASAPYRLLPVTAGLFAAGYVAISGTGIHSGLQVTDSQG